MLKAIPAAISGVCKEVLGTPGATGVLPGCPANKAVSRAAISGGCKEDSEAGRTASAVRPRRECRCARKRS